MISFTDSEELITFLKKSEAANYKWSDSEDLAVIAYIYENKSNHNKRSAG